MLNNSYVHTNCNRHPKFIFQMVNATVKFLKEKNCPVILNAVQAATVAFTEAGFLLTENGIKLAGCEQCARPVSTLLL